MHDEKRHGCPRIFEEHGQSRALYNRISLAQTGLCFFGTSIYDLIPSSATGEKRAQAVLQFVLLLLKLFLGLRKPFQEITAVERRLPFMQDDPTAEPRNIVPP